MQSENKTESGIRRRHLLKSGGIGIASGLAGCVGSLGSSEKLRIGGFHDVSGPIAIFGKKQREAFNTAIEVANEEGGVFDQDIEVTRYDIASDSVTKVRQAIEQDNIDVISGFISSAKVVQVQELLRNQYTDILFNDDASSSVPIVSTPNCTETFFRTEYELSQTNAAIRPLVEQHGSDFFFIAADYNYGHSSVSKAKQLIAEIADLDSPDDAAVGEEFVPTSQTDFRSLLSKADSADPDVIMATLVGGGYTSIINQAAELGIEVPLHHQYATQLGIAGAADSLNKVTVTGASSFSVSHNHDPTQEFVNMWSDRHGAPPTTIEGEVYDGVRMLVETYRDAGTKNIDEVISEYEGKEFPDSVRGEATTMRACDHSAIVPIFLEQATVGANGPTWEVTETLDNSDGQLMESCGAEQPGGSNRCDFSSSN